MRAVNLAKVAAEAEILRIQHMLKRQGVRAAFGLITVIFAVGRTCAGPYSRMASPPAVPGADLRDAYPARRRLPGHSDLWHIGCEIIAGAR